MNDTIARSIAEAARTTGALADTLGERIERVACVCVKALAKGGRIIVFGNGGSAADSQHFAAELVGRFKKERKALPAMALTTNSSTLTALANDYSYDIVFSRQIEAFGRPGDVAFAISTSGRSRSILEAARTARKAGMTVVGLTGGTGGDLAGACDEALIVPSADTPRIQEAHILIIHILCELIENGTGTG